MSEPLSGTPLRHHAVHLSGGPVPGLESTEAQSALHPSRTRLPGTADDTGIQCHSVLSAMVWPGYFSVGQLFFAVVC